MTESRRESVTSSGRDGVAARTHRERVDDVNRIKGLLYEGSLPWDEQSPNALMVTGGTQGGVYFIGRENFTAVAGC